MRNYLFSFTTILFLFITGGYTTMESNEADEAIVTSLEGNTFVLEDDLVSCSLTFSYSQDYTCCNTNTSGCACVNMTVNGLYNYGCQSTVTDIWFESIFLCSQGQWSGVSPTIKIYLDLYQACPSSCQYVYIPVTMKYNYNCGWGTCTGSYSKTVKMLLC